MEKKPRQNNEHLFISYPSSHKIRCPPKDERLANALNRIKTRVFDALEKEKAKSLCNLSQKERLVMKHLRNVDTIYLPSDKGTEFVAIKKTDYNSLCNDILSDASIYRKIARTCAFDVEEKINKSWVNMAKRREIEKRAKLSFLSRGTSFAKLYVLIKTHKENILKNGRPIIANVNSPTSKLAWLMKSLLTPLLDSVNQHLSNTYSLLKTLEGLTKEQITKTPFPVSLDVSSMYTNIPVPEEICAVKRRIIEVNYASARFPSSSQTKNCS